MLFCIQPYTIISLSGFHPPSNGAVRFYRQGYSTSVTYTSGIVQVLMDGTWGNICAGDVGFNLQEADVVCHQLQYTGASRVDAAAHSRCTTHIMK